MSTGFKVFNNTNISVRHLSISFSGEKKNKQAKEKNDREFSLLKPSSHNDIRRSLCRYVCSVDV